MVDKKALKITVKIVIFIHLILVALIIIIQTHILNTDDTSSL